MTVMIQDWLLKGILISLLLIIVFGFSLFVSKWLTKRGMERNKKWENLAAFIITIIVCAMYVGIEDQFIYWAYKGDIVVTEDSEEKIEEDAVRIITTEPLLHVYDIDTYGYLLRVSTPEEGTFEEEIRVNVTTTDYLDLYNVIIDSPNYLRSNGTLDFSLYVEEVLAPSIQKALKLGWEHEKNEEPAKKYATSVLEDQYPYHHFEIQ